MKASMWKENAFDKAWLQNGHPVEEPPNRPKRPPVEEPAESPNSPPPPSKPPVEEPPNQPDKPPVKEPPPAGRYVDRAATIEIALPA